MSLVHGLPYRIGVQSQKALGLITRMSSILLQIEVRLHYQGYHRYHHCWVSSSHPHWLLGSLYLPSHPNSCCYSTVQALANDSKQLDLSSLATSVQELGLSVSTQNYK